MHTQEFIQATHEVLRKSSDPAPVFKSLRAYLARRGLLNKYPSILKGLLDREVLNQKSTVPLVKIARKEDISLHELDIDTLLHEFQSKTYRTQIDTSLIGGFSIESAYKKIDKSYKHHLLQTYQRLQETK
jgi:F0F1-type ATP synthase delta subunit